MSARRVLVCDGNEKALKELAGMIGTYLGTEDTIMAFQEPEEMLMEIRKGEELPTVVFFRHGIGKDEWVRGCGKDLRETP